MAPISRSASTATATAAASSTTRRGNLRRQDRPHAGARPSKLHKNATFVVDVKSTGLYATDPVLKANGAKVDYWKTGHSYIKRRTTELNALAGFEKSGHFFFREPLWLWL
jgi:hypothetical protein